MNIDNYISSGIVEQYVMGLCTIEEKNELEQLRRQHAALDKAIIDFEGELEENLLKNALLPDSATDEKILHAFQSMTTPVIAINDQKNKASGFGWLKMAAAASFLLFCFSAVYNYSLFKKTKTLENQLALNSSQPVTLPVADYNILKDPAITPVAMYGVGYHTICRCTMFWDKKTGKVYIMIHHLPRSSDKKDFQLWAMVNDKPVSVGIINDAIRDRFIEMPNMPAGANAFTVTLENAGGAATPTIEETYLQGKI
jgi:anti-sigma-K factor RskA